MIRIDDADDPRVAVYRDIRERDLVGRQGRFIAEGRVVLNVLLGASRFEVESMLLLESRVAGSGELLERLGDRAPVYVAGPEVMDRIAGFPMHRGILAIGRRTKPDDIGGLLARLPGKALVVALAGISNHDNMGAIFRNAASFGEDAVVLDETCCDPLYRKAIRVSVGAALKVPYAVAGPVASMVASLAASGFEVLALSPAGKDDIGRFMPGKRTALLLGSEGHGLPPDLMAGLRTVRIPMADDFDSLNVAAASAIALHRLWRG